MLRHARKLTLITLLTVPALLATLVAVRVPATTATAEVAEAAVTTFKVAVAGDIACPPKDNSCKDLDTARLIESMGVDAVVTAGDNQYDSGSFADYSSPDGYQGSWGRFKAKTHPVPGNHEYMTSGAAGYFQYFGAAAKNPQGDPYYRWATPDGAWAFYMLNSEVAHEPGSAQVTWLQNQLAKETAKGTVAVWHRPVLTSPSDHESEASMMPLYQTFCRAGGDIAIQGHNHFAERFKPLDCNLQPTTSGGVTILTWGAGGRELYFRSSADGRSTFYASNFGVGFLELRSDGTWSGGWKGIPGVTAGDSFSGGGPAPTTSTQAPTTTAAGTIPTAAG